MKRIIHLSIILLTLLGAVSTHAHAAIKAGEASVKVGSTTTISLATTYQNTLRNSTGISARWSTSSSNVSITSQSNTSCTIKGVTAGSAQVNYYCSYYIDGFYRTMDFYYTVTITSSGSTATLTLTPSSITLYEGDTYQVTAYQPGYVGGVYFTTNNSSVASVSTSSNSGYYTYGTVTANSAGTTYIYAKSATGATSSACTVTVKTKTISPTSISLPASKTIEEGEYGYITATVSPSNATYSLTWSSNNTDVATVNSSGRVYGKSPGTVRITAKVDGYSLSDYCDVTVTAKQVLATSLSVDGPETLAMGDKYQLTPVYAPSNATVGFQYVSDNPDVISVSSTGLLTAVAVGTAVVTVTEIVSQLTAKVAIEVPEPLIPDTDLSSYDNVVYINPLSACSGQSLTFPVMMKNAVGIQTVQFDLYLPDGVTVAKDEDGFDLIELSTERTTTRKMDSFSSIQTADGAYRVLINSSGGYTFDGTDGEIARVTVNIVADMAEGDYPLILKDIVLVNTSSEGFETPYVKATLTVSDYSPGDVNGDGKVNAIDLNAIVNYILERRTFPFAFLEKAADQNSDNKINAIDVNVITNMILKGSSPQNVKMCQPVDVGVLENR